MKRVLLLVLLVIAVGVLTAADGGPFDWRGGRSMDGAWRLVSPEPPEGTEHIKVLAGGRFVWTTVRDGRIIRAAGGTYTARGNTYIESIEHVLHDDARWMVGKDIGFKRKLRRGTWHHSGVLKTGGGDVQLDEVWERVTR